METSGIGGDPGSENEVDVEHGCLDDVLVNESEADTRQRDNHILSDSDSDEDVDQTGRDRVIPEQSQLDQTECVGSPQIMLQQDDLEGFIQPEGVKAAECLPDDVVDQTLGIPFNGLPAFFDNKIEELQSEVADAFLHIAQLRNRLDKENESRAELQHDV